MRKTLDKLSKSRFFWKCMLAFYGISLVYLCVRETTSKIPTLPNLPKLRKIFPFSSNPADAIGRITVGNSGCSATITGPIASDDLKVHILSAAHCVRVGQKGRMKLKDGRELTIVCVSRDEASDAAWFEADNNQGPLPNVPLATTIPPAGSKIWHEGYGIDKPGNRESGVFVGTASGRPQYVFELSVSPGDSGGGIIFNDKGEVLSPVCCTTKLGGKGTVWGATSIAAAKIRPIIHRSDDNFEVHHPIIPAPAIGWPAPVNDEPETIPPGDPLATKKK